MNILICDDEQAVGERVLQLTRDFLAAVRSPSSVPSAPAGKRPYPTGKSRSIWRCWMWISTP